MSIIFGTGLAPGLISGAISGLIGGLIYGRPNKGSIYWVIGVAVVTTIAFGGTYSILLKSCSLILPGITGAIKKRL